MASTLQYLLERKTIGQAIRQKVSGELVRSQEMDKSITLPHQTLLSTLSFSHFIELLRLIPHYNHTMTIQEHTELREVSLALDFQRIDALIKQGYTLNCLNEQNDTLLAEICTNALWDKNPHICTIVRELLKRGADPNFRNSEQGSALRVAMWNMETQLLRVLLEAGANPNGEAGFDEGESFYEYAEFDYLYQIYDLHLPEQPTEADKLNPDTWLQFLDRIAVQYHRPRPDHLFLLRQFGAKTMKELENKI